MQQHGQLLLRVFAGALAVTITRVSGISLGVLISLVLSVLVFPRSASSEALGCIKEAMQALAELNTLAWQNGVLQHVQKSQQAGSPLGKPPLPNSSRYDTLHVGVQADLQLQ